MIRRREAQRKSKGRRRVERKRDVLDKKGEREIFDAKKMSEGKNDKDEVERKRGRGGKGSGGGLPLTGCHIYAGR